jgi:sulfatase modifying factor 1
VVIDGLTYRLTHVSGDHLTGAVFELKTTHLLGSHEYYFKFEDTEGTTVQTEVEDGPRVGVIVFQMGSPVSELGRNEDEVLHTVVLTRNLEAAAHEATQASFDSLMGYNPSRFQGDDRPVERVAWLEAIRYCNALSEAELLDPCYAVNGDQVTWNPEANGYRLPTEAEWECACRAGTETAFFTGDITEERCGLDPALNQAGWYCGNAPDSSTVEVMAKVSNDMGLYDTHGNVWEWCWDYYSSYEDEVALDPTGPVIGSRRVIRGGCWYYYARECRSAQRGQYWPNSADDIVGFRVVKNAD